MNITRYLSLKLIEELLGYPTLFDFKVDLYYQELSEKISEIDTRTTYLEIHELQHLEIKDSLFEVKNDYINMLMGVISYNNYNISLKTLISIYAATRMFMQFYIDRNRLDQAILFSYWMRKFLEPHDELWLMLCKPKKSLTVPAAISVGICVLVYNFFRI